MVPVKRPGKGTDGRVQRLSYPGPSSPPLPPSSHSWRCGLPLFLLVLALLSTASSPPRHHINPIPLRSPPCREAPRAAAGDKRAGAAAAAPQPMATAVASQPRHLPLGAGGEPRCTARFVAPLRSRLRCCSAPRFGCLAVRS